jgi:hypothetical protein
MGTGGSFPGLKQPGRQADRSTPSSTEVENIGAKRSLPHTSSWRGVWLIKLMLLNFFEFDPSIEA